VSISTNVFLLIVFITASSIAILVGSIFIPKNLENRLLLNKKINNLVDKNSNFFQKMINKFEFLLRPLTKLSQPDKNSNPSQLKINFLRAGWKSASTIPIFYGIKTLLALTFPFFIFIAAVNNLIIQPKNVIFIFAIITSAIGYYIPNVIKAHYIKKRQQEIFDNLPDALDLLTICVESGLGLDQAIARVAKEMHLTSRALSEELEAVLMEVRSGFSKEQAFRNLALRTGVLEIELLTAMLIQTERFGTSIGESLRIHSENARTKKRQNTEEAAAKIAIKLLFPLIFFIFPTLLMVLLGPAILQIVRVLLPAFSSS
jgi:tight adherence protein C